MNASDIEEEDQRDVIEAERRLADAAEVPIPYEQARRELFPEPRLALDAQDIEAIVAPVEGPARNILLDPDKWLCDLDTGAIVGRLDVPDHFRIDSTDAAEWALELRAQIEQQIVALDARLEALRTNLLTLRAEQVRRLNWWDWRFGSQLVDFARRMLAGGKKRTWTCPWGRVSFRRTPGTKKILDGCMSEAVAFVRAWEPGRVRVVETVGVKDVEAVMEAIARATEEEPEKPGWLKHSGESENVTIDTGIHIKKGDENGD
jgi:hypothetical protein